MLRCRVLSYETVAGLLVCCVIFLWRLPRAADAALNVHHNIAESFIGKIRHHIFVDDSFTMRKSNAYRSCSSLEGTSCPSLAARRRSGEKQLETFAGSRRSSAYRALSGDPESVPVLEEDIGEDERSATFSMVVSDHVSWLVTQANILSGWDIRHSDKKFESSDNVGDAGSRHQNVSDEAAATDEHQPFSPVGFIKSYLQQPRSFFKELHQFFSAVMRFITAEDDEEPSAFYSNTEGSASFVQTPRAKTESLQRILGGNRSGRERAMSSASTSVKTQSSKGKSLGKVTWETRLSILEIDGITSSAVPEFFGSDDSPAGVAVRWVGTWAVGTSFESNRDNKAGSFSERLMTDPSGTKKVLPRCAVLTGGRHALLFSKPVVLSMLQLQVLVSRQRLLQRGQNGFLESRIFVEGFFWDKERANLSATASDSGWFFSPLPLDMLQHHNIHRVWSAEIDLDSATTHSDAAWVVDYVDAVRKVTGSPYTRIDGVILTFSTGTTVFAGIDGYKKQRQIVTMEKRVSSLRPEVCLHRFGFRRRTAVNPSSSVPVSEDATTVDGIVHELEAMAYRPGIIVRPLEDDPALMVVKPPGYDKSPTSAELLQKYDREVWEFDTLQETELRLQQYVSEKRRYHASIPRAMPPFNQAMFSTAVLPFPEICSDGVTLHWDYRPPMRRVTILGQKKIPVEAPVHTLMEVHEARHVVAQRPCPYTTVYRRIVPADTEYPVSEVRREVKGEYFEVH